MTNPIQVEQPRIRHPAREATAPVRGSLARAVNAAPGPFTIPETDPRPQPPSRARERLRNLRARAGRARESVGNAADRMRERIRSRSRQQNVEPPVAREPFPDITDLLSSTRAIELNGDLIAGINEGLENATPTEQQLAFTIQPQDLGSFLQGNPRLLGPNVREIPNLQATIENDRLEVQGTIVAQRGLTSTINFQTPAVIEAREGRLEVIEPPQITATRAQGTVRRLVEENIGRLNDALTQALNQQIQIPGWAVTGFYIRDGRLGLVVVNSPDAPTDRVSPQRGGRILGRLRGLGRSRRDSRSATPRDPTQPPLSPDGQGPDSSAGEPVNQEQQPLLVATEQNRGARPIQEMFNDVIGDFEEPPGNRYTISPERIREVVNPGQYIFRQQEAFIILDGIVNGRNSWHASQRLAPYAYDNPQVPPGTPLIDSTVVRYANGERITRGDSGLFALSAAATANHEDQTQLYIHLANAILDIHDRNQGLQLRWLNAQRQRQQNNWPRSSYDVFVYNDTHDPITGQEIIRPREEELLAYSSYNPPTFNQDTFTVKWRENLRELREAIRRGMLEPYHLRQLEFLSHSIDIEKMFTDMRDQPPSTRYEPPPTQEISYTIEQLEDFIPGSENFTLVDVDNTSRWREITQRAADNVYNTSFQITRDRNIEHGQLVTMLYDFTNFIQNQRNIDTHRSGRDSDFGRQAEAIVISNPNLIDLRLTDEQIDQLADMVSAYMNWGRYLEEPGRAMLNRMGALVDYLSMFYERPQASAEPTPTSPVGPRGGGSSVSQQRPVAPTIARTDVAPSLPPPASPYPTRYTALAGLSGTPPATGQPVRGERLEDWIGELGQAPAAGQQVPERATEQGAAEPFGSADELF